jgi:hypothetical protein
MHKANKANKTLHDEAARRIRNPPPPAWAVALIEAMGGSVAVENLPSRGALFTIRLPA